MDQIFDRLGNLLKSFVREDSDSFARPSGSRPGGAYADPDLQDAWEELDDFLKSDGNEAPRSEPKPRKPSIPETLRPAYKNLEVPFGASIGDVAKSYKKLLRTHHPDKHATDPSAYAKATEKTKKLTESFRKIKDFFETGKVS